MAGVNRLAAHGMNKIQLAGMQHQPGRVFSARHVKTAIQIATQNRVPQLLAVNALLMGSPGLRDQFHPR